MDMSVVGAISGSFRKKNRSGSASVYPPGSLHARIDVAAQASSYYLGATSHVEPQRILTGASEGTFTVHEAPGANDKPKLVLTYVHDGKLCAIDIENHSVRSAFFLLVGQ
jgi:hypothetical protein